MPIHQLLFANHVTTVFYGHETLYTARAEKPNLILLSIIMSEVSGYEFIKTYQRECETAIIVIFAPSGPGRHSCRCGMTLTTRFSTKG